MNSAAHVVSPQHERLGPERTVGLFVSRSVTQLAGMAISKTKTLNGGEHMSKHKPAAERMACGLDNQANIVLAGKVDSQLDMGTLRRFDNVQRILFQGTSTATRLASFRAHGRAAEVYRRIHVPQGITREERLILDSAMASWQSDALRDAG
jgi:hypothetical protein